MTQFHLSLQNEGIFNSRCFLEKRGVYDYLLFVITNPKVLKMLNKEIPLI